MNKARKLAFIASPVSHPDPVMVKKRVAEAGRFAHWIIENEPETMAFAGPCHLEFIFPHVKGVNIYEWLQVHTDTFIGKCDEVRVLRLEGWDKSTGLKQELVEARRLGKPISYWDLDGDKSFIKVDEERQ